MKNLLVIALSCLLASPVFAATKTKSTSTHAKKTVVTTEEKKVETTTPAATTHSTTSHSSSTSSFNTREIFNGDNKSELFLSVTQASLNSADGGSNLSISGMYTYLIQEQIQVGAEIAFGSTSGKFGTGYSSSDVYALGIYNFTPVLTDAAFAFGGIGLGTAKFAGTSESKMGFKVGAGKRFPLVSKLQYVPMAWIQKVGDASPVLNLMPVNFSLIF